MKIKWSEIIIRFLFPAKCIFCEDILVLSTPIEICTSCFENIPFTSELDLIDEGNCYNRIFCLGEYEGILKDALIKFKFSEKPHYYRALGEILAEKLLKMTNIGEFDFIICVPLFKAKYLKRGYNQAWLLAKEIGKQFKMKSTKDLIRRIRNTKSQKDLSKIEREMNLKNVFVMNKKYTIEGKNILLIDDIMTTGTTLKECSMVLKEAGANNITSAVIASGRKY